MSKGITILSYRLSYSRYTGELLCRHKKKAYDRDSVHAKKDDFGTKKPRKKQSCDAPISKQESHIRDLCSYFTG